MLGRGEPTRALIRRAEVRRAEVRRAEVRRGGHRRWLRVAGVTLALAGIVLAGIIGAGVIGAAGSVPPAQAAAPRPAPLASSVRVLTVDGLGWGHGVGMSQDGAYWMARGGMGTEGILGHFYPGTALGRSGGQVRVPVAQSPTGDAGLSFPDGGEVRDSLAGRERSLTIGPGGWVRVWFDGARYHASPMAQGQAAGERLDRLALIAARGQYLQPVASTTTSSTTSTTSTTGTSSTTSTSTTTTTTPTIPTTEPPVTTSVPAPPATVAPTTTTTTVAAPPAPPAPPPPLGAAVPPAAEVAPLPQGPPAPDAGPPPPAPVPPPAEAAPLPAPPPGIPEVSSTSPLWLVPADGGTTGMAGGRRYRGVVQAQAAAGGLRLVDVVDIEQYLRGMGEVRDGSWPPAALRAQAIAARTYALRAMAGRGEICADDRCQVYLGTQAEYGAMDRAVSDTRGQVVMSGGALAQTFYSASGGGISATPEEGFGTAVDVPYLRAAPYPTADPLPWRMQVALSDLARVLEYPGAVAGAQVSRVGPSGRPLSVRLEGSAGPLEVDAQRVVGRLRLRSNLFRVAVDDVAEPPPPPPPPPPAEAVAEPSDDPIIPVPEEPSVQPARPTVKVILESSSGARNHNRRGTAFVLAALAWVLAGRLLVALVTRRARRTSGAGSGDVTGVGSADGYDPGSDGYDPWL